MALAKPIIATEGGGTAEIVQHRTTGFLIAPKSPDVLAEKIQQLMHDDQLAIQMGQAGKKIIQEQFTIEKMCNTFFATYQELASK
jgi:glycosyltransferase involved in cell wall biosynthesis